MPTETMTPRERWLAVLDRRTPDRVPMDYWGTAEITAKLMQHFACDSYREMLQKMRIDFVIAPNPRYVGPRLKPDRDVFDIQYRNVDYGTGIYDEAVSSPLAGFGSVKEIEDGSADIVAALLEALEEIEKPLLFTTRDELDECSCNRGLFGLLAADHEGLLQEVGVDCEVGSHVSLSTH